MKKHDDGQTGAAGKKSDHAKTSKKAAHKNDGHKH